ncbi:MAG: FAD-dependent monooxygenase [Ilumatobacteraceae bacterium]
MTDDTTRDVDADVDADVAIVGLGPTGLVLAILLAQRGHRVVAFERWPEPYPLPRAVHFDHEVGRILQACGIGDELRTIIEPAGIYEWRNAAGATLLRFGRDGDAASGWPASSMFSQPDLERLLSDRLASLDGVDVRRGVEIVALEQRDGRVDLVTADDRRVGAMYVVGCDGARSTVRDLVGIEMTDHGFFYDWLIVDVELHEPRVFEPTNLQVCDPARPTTALSGPVAARRWSSCGSPTAPSTTPPRGAGVGAARTVGHPAGQLHPRPPRRHLCCTPRLRVACRLGCSSPAAPRRCRRSPGRGCVPVSATP